MWLVPKSPIRSLLILFDPLSWILLVQLLNLLVLAFLKRSLRIFPFRDSSWVRTTGELLKRKVICLCTRYHVKASENMIEIQTKCIILTCWPCLTVEFYFSMTILKIHYFIYSHFSYKHTPIQIISMALTCLKDLVVYIKFDPDKPGKASACKDLLMGILFSSEVCVFLKNKLVYTTVFPQILRNLWIISYM